MNEEPVSDKLLRQFLLGKADDRERQRLESMFVTGALSKERVEAAEQHLLDDYLEDSLTPADKERFLAQFGDTPSEQRKLRIARSIKDWAATSTQTVPVAAVVHSRWSRLREYFRLKPVFAIPIAAMAVLAIVFAAVWLNTRWEQRNRHLAMLQELTRLNAPATVRDVSPSTPVLTLMPGSVRSAERENELTPPVNAEFVEVRLVWTQKERYSSHQATIRRFDPDESFPIPALQTEDGGNIILLRLPTPFLTRGLYVV